MARRREFVMSVSAGGHTCSGTGPNKKLAKRAAAEALLVELGYSRPQPPVGRPSLKQAGAETDGADRSRRVTFQDGAAPAESGTVPAPAPAPAPAVGRQLVPGLILVPQAATAAPSGGAAAQSMAAAAKELGKAAVPAEPTSAAAPQPAAQPTPRQVSVRAGRRRCRLGASLLNITRTIMLSSVEPFRFVFRNSYQNHVLFSFALLLLTYDTIFCPAAGGGDSAACGSGSAAGSGSGTGRRACRRLQRTTQAAAAVPGQGARLPGPVHRHTTGQYTPSRA